MGRTFLYLSIFPEALIASMLPPEEFGVYYAVGSHKKTHGQAVFFSVDPGFRSDSFLIEEGIKRCVPHENGDPKRSIYISIYRVIERVPVSALIDLHLTTQDGRTLALKRGAPPPRDEGFHLYQELVPISPLVASTLGPEQYNEFLTDTQSNSFALPAVLFAEYRLGALSADPEFGEISDLPYSNVDHLRQCLADLKGKRLGVKIVERTYPGILHFRAIKNGLFLGNRQELLYYPLPPKEEMLKHHYQWWRSAHM